MKKYLVFILALCFALLVACSENNNENESSSQQKDENKKIQIYTTVYPLSYFTERIGGEFVEVSSVYPPGANEHSFEPTQQDMIKFANADLLFYIGLGLEGFIESAEKTLANENVKFVATTENVPEEKYKLSKGAQVDEHLDEEDENHTERAEVDEVEHSDVDAHVWLSTSISQDLALSIKDALVQEMPEQADVFNENYQKLMVDLKDIDGQFKEMVAQAKNRTFFVSHAAFGYIAGTYDLQQVPIAGLNSQNEPSQKELAQIIDLANKLNIKYIIFEQNVSSKLAKVIQSEIGAEALTLHNLSVLTEEDIKNGETYLTIMEQNVETLRQALDNK
ncbi:zinc ABC transporter substrate-binding protein [Lysinibacillus sp. M3]|uniref:Zinc ABC transporter substrate-binding protein n=1 Tax=Lysinibacillus zambalensis TaxID=3160866 RepID=A0ABV1ML07_9BACI